MGITGLYSELGPGERISLAKFASDHFEATGRRLRLAVDASIWSFQVQAGKGGTNPALRTLYYRLLRLYQLNITPLFVFDGRKRPAFKRNHKTNAHITPALQKNTKSFLKLFGFPYHEAPGEAEAECAVLQQQGVVDAVLSEDVDTLMFGCRTTFRNWSGEGKAGKTTPTHVTMYDNESVRVESGLTPNGMILVALMSGGDYLPEGVPKCGIRTAVEAAKAGFGEDLCMLEEDDEEGFREWRERLSFELETNESGWFRRKNKAIKIPEDFPDKMVLGYYTNPAVSSQEAIEKLRMKIVWNGKVDVFRLRESVRYAFEWKGKGGAAKFVRTLAPAILAWKLADGEEKSELESIVKGFHGKREHFSTDGLKELRISFVPGEVIKIDMDAEEEDEVSEQEDEEDGECVRKPKDYDIFAIERIWVQDMFARRSLREMIEEWETPKITNSRVTKKVLTKTKTKSKEGTMSGSILKYLDISKPSSQNIMEKSRAKSPEIKIWEDMEALNLSASKEPCEVSEPEETPGAHSSDRSTEIRKSTQSLQTGNPTGAPQPKRTAPRSKVKASKPLKKPAQCLQEENLEEFDEECINSLEIVEGPPPCSVTRDASQPHNHCSPIFNIHEESFSESLYSTSRFPRDKQLLLNSDALLPPSPPPARTAYETILIESSPIPALDINESYNSPPITPSQRRRSSSAPLTHENSSRISQKLRAPSPAGSPGVELSPPHTPTAAFGRLQVVDLLEDSECSGDENSMSRVLDFSPSAHLSPNITTKRKGRKVKTRELQPELEKVKAKKKYILTSPIPFPIPAARRPHPTSPLRRMFSASDTASVSSVFVENIRDSQVELASEKVETIGDSTISKEISEDIRAGVVCRKVDGGFISTTAVQETKLVIAGDRIDTTGTTVSTRIPQDIRVEVASVGARVTDAIVSKKTTKKGRDRVVSEKTIKRIVLRESLEGQWEFIEDDWNIREGKKVWKDVEVLDLTGDD